jgi:RimJ/RimL family protein N-acetyltransferase
MILTPNLRLIPVEPAHAAAVLEDRRTLAALLGVVVPEGWPVFPRAFAAPAARAFGGYLFVAPRERALVGNGGYKGPPDVDGAVEIGYEIAPAFRGRGLATEAARALVAHALTRPGVRLVCAHTLPEESPSTQVLRKIGMRFAGETAARTWRFERAVEAR